MPAFSAVCSRSAGEEPVVLVGTAGSRVASMGVATQLLDGALGQGI